MNDSNNKQVNKKNKTDNISPEFYELISNISKTEERFNNMFGEMRKLMKINIDDVIDNLVNSNIINSEIKLSGDKASYSYYSSEYGFINIKQYINKSECSFVISMNTKMPKFIISFTDKKINISEANANDSIDKKDSRLEESFLEKGNRYLKLRKGNYEILNNPENYSSDKPLSFNILFPEEGFNNSEVEVALKNNSLEFNSNLVDITKKLSSNKTYLINSGHFDLFLNIKANSKKQESTNSTKEESIVNEASNNEESSDK